MTLSITHNFVSAIADDPAAAAAGEVVPSNWNADHTVTGTVGPEVGARTVLTANQNYYVSSTGSDSNPGTSLLPWATIQHAANVISSTLDFGGFSVTVNIGAGTFAGVGLKSCLGGGNLEWIGASVSTTTIDAGPNDGVYNFGECFSAYVVVGAVLYIHELTCDGTSAFSAGAAYTCFFGPGNNIKFDSLFSPFTGNLGLVLGHPVQGIGASGCVVADSQAEAAGPTVTVTGSTLTNVYDVTNCQLFIGSNYVFASGTPSFSAGFFLTQFSYTQWFPLSVGAFTGPSAVIETNSSVQDFIPSLESLGSGVIADGTSTLATGAGLPDAFPPGFELAFQNSGPPDTTFLAANHNYGFFQDTNTSLVAGFLNNSGTIEQITRYKLTANTSFYVSTTGSDSNPGTSGSPWATLQHAMFYIAANLDIAGFTVTVNIGTGSFAGLGVASTIGGGIVQFLGNGPSNTTVTAGPNDGVFNFGECLDVFVVGTSFIGMDQVTFGGTPAVGIAIYTSGVSVAFNPVVASNVEFNVSTNCAFVLVEATGSIFQQEAGGTVSYVMNGNAPAQILGASDGGGIIDTSAWTLSGAADTMTNGFFQGDVDAFFQSFGTTFAGGSPNGPRFQLLNGSNVNSNGSGLTLFPGSTQGVADFSSHYDGSAVPLTVALLTANFPAANYEGSSMFVTDSTATLAGGLGNIVAGSGADKVPVYSDGTNWRIG